MKCLQMFPLLSLKGLKKGLKKALRRLDFRKKRLQVCFKPKGLAMDDQSLLKVIQEGIKMMFFLSIFRKINIIP